MPAAEAHVDHQFQPKDGFMTDTKQKSERTARPPAWTEEEVRRLIEPARRPFLTVVKRDNLPLVWAREADYAVQLILKDTRFRECSEYSIASAVKNLVFVGLSLNPTRQHAIILARFIRWPTPEHYEAGIMVMYRGLMHLATEAGAHDIRVEAVYKGDHFESGSSSKRGDWYEYKRDPADQQDEKDFMGAFCAARMPGGATKFEWMTRKDVLRARDSSDSYLDRNDKPSKYSPWVKWFGEMAKKVVIKRASKRWEEMMGDSERWARFLEAVRIDNEAEGVIKPRPDDIEGELDHLDKAPPKPEVLLLEHEQVSAIKALAPGAAFQKKICEAIGVKKLEEIPAIKYHEIIQRIETAKQEQAKKAAKGK